jgi:hypothetical protein
MNFEALGKYHHLRSTRADTLRKLHIMGKAVVTLGRNLDNYNPPYPGIDNITEDIAHAEVAIAGIKALVQQAGDQWAEMQRLKTEYNLE